MPVRKHGNRRTKRQRETTTQRHEASDTWRERDRVASKRVGCVEAMGTSVLDQSTF